MTYPADPVPFEQWMASALHDPQDGYYARNISGVGRRGDFTTVPMVSRALARAIAAWLVGAMREMACRNVIEIGPGEGSLASDVLKQLPWYLRRKVRLHLVETSAPLEERQRKQLGTRAMWHRDMQSALTACRGNALIFSNELVDAFPVRRFQSTSLGWQEMAVSFTALGCAQESLLPLADVPDSTVFQQVHPLGQRVEVHDSYRKSLCEWLPGWRSGRLLTIDYGDRVETLYHRRPRGTLRAYAMQQRLEGMEIYANCGRQDLTADVNFSDLARWTAPWVDSQELMSLAVFLEAHSVPLERCFMEAGGVGEAFLVLDERR